VDSLTKESDIEEKVRVTLASLLEAKRMKDQILTILNAYYLGEILEKSPFHQKTQLKRLISLHYYEVSIRAYYLFRTIGKEQIHVLDGVTLTSIRKLNDQHFRQLVRYAELLTLQRHNLV
jgi:hypothetical protein